MWYFNTAFSFDTAILRNENSYHICYDNCDKIVIICLPIFSETDDNSSKWVDEADGASKSVEEEEKLKNSGEDRRCFFTRCKLIVVDFTLVAYEER